jgi:photosystem II stability/assembly factor-like uncharacterized protein
MRLSIFILIIFLICITISAEENEWSNIGPAGARVMTIEIHPFDNQKVYLGTVENGMYKSTDSGNSWEHVEGLIANLNVRDIEIHPVGPDTIYVATVDGMYKSTTSGQSWNLLEPPHYPLNEIRALLVHPTHPNIILAGGPTSKWISTNSGDTWEELNTGEYVGIDDFAYNPQNEDILYFASGSMHVGLGIWKSEDMGQSWFSIQNNLDSTGFGEAIAVDPFNSNVLYFTRNDHYQQSGHVVSKSTNGGLTWFDITPDSLLPPPMVLDVAVSPIVQNTVFICALNDGILRSADGGTTWERVNTGLNNADAYSIKIDSVTGILYLGTLYNGIYKSTDGGDSWEKISYNINLSNCSGLAFDNGNENLLFVLTSNLLYRTLDVGQTWEIFGPDIPETHRVRGIKVDPQFVNVVYSCTGHASGSSQIDSAGFYRSTDSGESWEFYNIGLPPENSYYKIAVSVSSTGARRLFLASTQGLYYSDDEGDSWGICSNGLPLNSWYYKIDVAPSNPDIVVVGDLSNNVFISSNQGDSWSSAGNIPGGGLQITGLKFDPFSENIIYVSSLNSGLYKSIDGGSSWNLIINNLPIDSNYIGIAPILINPLNPSNVFVCSYKRGVYQSHNGGGSWEPINNGLDTVIFFGDMIFAPEDTNSIIYASRNKSVWTITRTATNINQETIEIPSKISIKTYPNPFNSQVTIEYSIGITTHINIDLYDILGRKVRNLLDGEISAGTHKAVWNGENDEDRECPSGVYLAKLTQGKLDSASKLVKLILLK